MASWRSSRHRGELATVEVVSPGELAWPHAPPPRSSTGRPRAPPHHRLGEHEFRRRPHRGRAKSVAISVVGRARAPPPRVSKLHADLRGWGELVLPSRGLEMGGGGETRSKWMSERERARFFFSDVSFLALSEQLTHLTGPEHHVIMSGAELLTHTSRNFA